MECMNGCPVGDQPCLIDCLFAGSQESQDLYMAVLDCIVAACGEEMPVECQYEALDFGGACWPQLEACMNDM